MLTSEVGDSVGGGEFPGESGCVIPAAEDESAGSLLPMVCAVGLFLCSSRVGGAVAASAGGLLEGAAAARSEAGAGAVEFSELS